MAGGIWEALGRALQTGATSWNALSTQESEDKRRDEEMRRRNAEFQQQMQLSRDQFASQQAEQAAARTERENTRKGENIRAAIEAMSPDDLITTDNGYLADIKTFAPEQFLRLKTTQEQLPSVDVREGVPTELGGDGGKLVSEGEPYKAPTIARNPTLAEKNAIEEIAQRKKVTDFQTRMSSPEFAALPFDQAQREAASFGIQLPMTSAEWDRRQKVEHQNRMREIGAQTAWHGTGTGTPQMDALVQAVIENPSAYAGFPAALKAKLAQPLAAAGFNFTTPPSQPSEYNQERQQRVLDAVADLKERVSGWTTGAGAALASIPATAARSFRSNLKTLQSNIMMNELVEMRAASKTGGALGQVSDKEGDLLQNALGALDNWQRPTEVYKQLVRIEESIARWNQAKARLIQNYSPTGNPRGGRGGGPGTPNVTGPNTGATPGKIGRFEIVEGR